MTRPAPAALFESAREFFLLREAERRASGIEPAVRPDFARDVDRARQKREAAEVLWAQGSVAEALALAQAAVDLAASAVERAGLDLEHKDALLAARDAARATPLPELDRDVGPEHLKTFRRLVDLQRRVDPALAPIALTDGARTRARRARAVASVGAAAVVLFGLAWSLLHPGPPRVEASATWSARFPADNLVDGIESSEWLLPDHTAGWVDVVLPRPRPVTALRVLNGFNKGDPDRGTLDYEIEVFVGGQVVKRIPGTLAPFVRSPPWKTIDVGVPQKVTKLRFHVKSWAGAGGGLAELAVD